MPVEFVAAGTSVSAGTIHRPPGMAVGDVMLAFVANREKRSDSSIAGGWTKVTQPGSNATNTTSMGVFWKAYESGDPSSWSVSAGGVSAYRTIVLGYRGASTTDPIESFSTSFDNSASPTWPSLTIVNAEMVVGAVSLIQSGITGPAGVTERWPLVAPESGDVTGWGFDKAVSAGATGSFDATTTPGGTSNGWATALVSLKPGGPEWAVGRVAWGAESPWH